MALLVRSRTAKVLWLLWAPWVWFAVMSTGNHYWLRAFLPASPSRESRH